MDDFDARRAPPGPPRPFVPMGQESPPASPEVVAGRLASGHVEIEPAIEQIYWIKGGEGDREIRLLEVNPNTVPTGVVPVHFGSHPPSGITYPSVVVEVTPTEFGEIRTGVKPLPPGWDWSKGLRFEPSTGRFEPPGTP